MHRYCNKCKEEEPHVKYGFSGNMQRWQCKECGSVFSDRSHKKEPSRSINIRLSQEYINMLDYLPGDTISSRIRGTIKACYNLFKEGDL